MSSQPAYIWINGRVVATSEARLSPFDHGFTVGDGVFESLPARALKPFALQRHWQRLTVSCDALGIQVPDIELMRTAMVEVMQANGLSDARLRFTVSSGDGPPGTPQGDGPPTILAVATPLIPWPATEKILVVPWTRNETGALAGLKCTSYAENVRALRMARSAGAGEAILGNTKGELCEGTGSNIFVVIDGIILTPPLESGCLAGVTRALAIEACQAAGIPVEERAVPLSVLDEVDEAFLTSSTRDVHPISEINGRLLNKAPGELTQKAAAAFAEYVTSVVD
ncbi:MAG: branched-chain amino acid aminotransferase/4-amino-4-deoxychorismate lyase [Verrucomicrobiaceae bacterium]|nr:branched-chain amino acid aminotransferase/4-amino-4-deoxychorismate lyase [Verrucomicrobiaceae bacterium]